MFYYKMSYDELSVENATLLLADVNFKKKNSNSNKNYCKPIVLLQQLPQ